MRGSRAALGGRTGTSSYFLSRRRLGVRVPSLPPLVHAATKLFVRRVFDIAHGRLAKEAAVFSVELTDALVADFVSCACSIQRQLHGARYPKFHEQLAGR